MPIPGQQPKYLLKSKFRVRVEGEDYGSFVTAGPLLEHEMIVAEIHSGESNVVESQSATKVKFTPVVLTQGAAKNSKMADWAEEVVDKSGVGGGEDPDYKKTVEIEQLGHDGNPTGLSWVHYEAFPSKFSDGEFDGASGEYRMTSVTLTFRYGERKVA